MTGNTDRPIEKLDEDDLDIEKYITGLSSFVQACDTPMTIAIQGDWGSGKTSFMNLIRNEIKDEVVHIWFNTWQFSQFSLGDSLPTLLLSALVEQLDADTGARQNIKRATKLVGMLSNAVLAKVTDVNVADILRDTVDSDSIIKSITELKSNFQKCVDTTLAKTGKHRLVVFVDDLDRLPPARAVEVLEVLKLFLDCRNCVFVLAIDYSVVCSGIDEKYGKSIDADKGRSFFDKIIQVPFKMPIASYKIKKYISKMLASMGFSTEHIEVYTNLISLSIGYNPRGLKRIFNAYQLLKEIYGKKEDSFDTPQKQSMLFAVLCLQLSYETIYNNFVRNENGTIDAQLMTELADPKREETESVSAFFNEIETDDFEENREEIWDFMAAFCAAIKNGKNSIEESDMETLWEILTISGTTSTVFQEQSFGNGKIGKGARYANDYDIAFSEHSIEEPLEKENALTGWNGCILQGYRLFDGDLVPQQNFTQLVVDVVSALYEEDPERFMRVRENSQQEKLQSFFFGSKVKGFVTPKTIKNTNIQIETKNNYNQKIAFLRRLLEAMGKKPGDLKITLKLSHRKSQA